MINTSTLLLSNSYSMVEIQSGTERGHNNIEVEAPPLTCVLVVDKNGRNFFLVVNDLFKQQQYLQHSSGLNQNNLASSRLILAKLVSNDNQPKVYMWIEQNEGAPSSTSHRQMRLPLSKETGFIHIPSSVNDESDYLKTTTLQEFLTDVLNQLLHWIDLDKILDCYRASSLIENDKYSKFELNLTCYLSYPKKQDEKRSVRVVEVKEEVAEFVGNNTTEEEKLEVEENHSYRYILDSEHKVRVILDEVELTVTNITTKEVIKSTKCLYPLVFSKIGELDTLYDIIGQDDDDEDDSTNIEIEDSVDIRYSNTYRDVFLHCTPKFEVSYSSVLSNKFKVYYVNDKDEEPHLSFFNHLVDKVETVVSYIHPLSWIEWALREKAPTDSVEMNVIHINKWGRQLRRIFRFTQSTISRIRPQTSSVRDVRKYDDLEEAQLTIPTREVVLKYKDGYSDTFYCSPEDLIIVRDILEKRTLLTILSM
eukprot:TRINITY_DN7041_c0_g1_i1.p1 TRINITY_DN7041_c0_g1~~TRINITY_DN7041_c0_g1_i1.p1  ORF type:complete len:478 (+),score=61.07 TRINITY_DN7041_c0_g1_i1:685-2118(+)